MAFFKEGQTVYCAIYGKGVVREITNEPDFPIEVEINGITKSYTSDGRYQKNYLPTLSQKPIPEIVNKHLPEFNLTFAQAMEAVNAGKKVQCETFGEICYIKFKKNDGSYDDVIQVFKKDKYATEYIIEKLELTAKWRIVD